MGSAALALLAAGCGGGGHHSAAPSTRAVPPPKKCTLTATQRRDLAKAEQDLRRLRQIEKPLHKFSQRGTPAQERLTGKLLLDAGNLPVLENERLIRLGKSAVGLCGLCFQAFEAEEPALADKSGENLCGSGS